MFSCEFGVKLSQHFRFPVDVFLLLLNHFQMDSLFSDQGASTSVQWWHHVCCPAKPRKIPRGRIWCWCTKWVVDFLFPKCLESYYLFWCDHLGKGIKKMVSYDKTASSLDFGNSMQWMEQFLLGFLTDLMKTTISWNTSCRPKLDFVTGTVW